MKPSHPDAPGVVDDAPPQGPENLDLAIKRKLTARILGSPGLVDLVGRSARREVRGRRVAPDVGAMLNMDALVKRLTQPTIPPPPEDRRAMALSCWTVEPEPPRGVFGEDRVLQGEDGAISLRIYTPQRLSSATTAGLVYIHGGGWVSGSVATHDVLCRRFALAADCRVLSLRYRLAPEHPYPAAIDDTRLGYLLVREHAEALGLDPERIAVGGDSAGGHLSALIAQHYRRAPHRPKLQLLIYPAVDLTRSFPSQQDFGDGFLLTSEKIDWYLNHFLPSEVPRKSPDVSPYFADDLSGVAPALVYTAGFDPLLDEGEAYAKRLEAAGVAVTYRCFEDQIHGFANMVGTVRGARRAFDAMAGDLRDGLKT